MTRSAPAASAGRSGRENCHVAKRKGAPACDSGAGGSRSVPVTSSSDDQRSRASSRAASSPIGTPLIVGMRMRDPSGIARSAVSASTRRPGRAPATAPGTARSR